MCCWAVFALSDAAWVMCCWVSFRITRLSLGNVLLVVVFPVARRSLGGKLGQSLMEELGVEMMGDLKAFSLQHLQAAFGDKTGSVCVVCVCVWGGWWGTYTSICRLPLETRQGQSGCVCMCVGGLWGTYTSICRLPLETRQGQSGCVCMCGGVMGDLYQHVQASFGDKTGSAWVGVGGGGVNGGLKAFSLLHLQSSFGDNTGWGFFLFRYGINAVLTKCMFTMIQFCLPL